MGVDETLRRAMRDAAVSEPALARLAYLRCHRFGIHRFEWGLMCLDCNVDIGEAMLEGDPGILPAWQRSDAFTIERTEVVQIAEHYRRVRDEEEAERVGRIEDAIKEDLDQLRAEQQERFGRLCEGVFRDQAERDPEGWKRYWDEHWEYVIGERRRDLRDAWGLE